MSKFKVGDKVRTPYGEGKIIEISDVRTYMNYFVYGETLNGHESTRYPEKTGLHFIWVSESDMTIVSEQPRREFIVIRRSGAETIAKLRHDREVIKSAVATCSEKDAFDFETGAKIAFDKLTGRYVKPAKEPKPAPQPTHRFKVGDRVVTPIGTGIVIRDDKSDVPYCIAYKDHPRFGNFNVWSRECDTSPAPEPPKFYAGKVFAEKSDDAIFASRDGRVFEFVDGKCINSVQKDLMDFGAKFPTIDRIRKEYSSTTWREVKSDV